MFGCLQPSASAIFCIYKVGLYQLFHQYCHGPTFQLDTWNLFVLYFGGWTLQNKVFSNQNKGHLGSRYIYIYKYHHDIYIYIFILYLLLVPWKNYIYQYIEQNRYTSAQDDYVKTHLISHHNLPPKSLQQYCFNLPSTSIYHHTLAST